MLKVVQQGSVLLLDSNPARFGPERDGQPFAATGVELHVMCDGFKAHFTFNRDDDHASSTNAGSKRSSIAF